METQREMEQMMLADKIDMIEYAKARTLKKCREEFERITESLYEGDFHTYDNGEYQNEIQQYHWEGFHDGWKAALNNITQHTR